MFRYAAVQLTETKVFRNLLDAILELTCRLRPISRHIKGADLEGNEVVRTFF